ncbi:MAG: carboxypeptidase regulatory-like domain-containing protein [Acidobacteriaceae bacterium]|nr:carboxypeptidase regulatory-like domain-containing protein [Acidobacteriaceae bacterium]
MTLAERRWGPAKSLPALALLACAALGFSASPETPFVGQTPGVTRAIEGTVLSEQGSPVPGAIVLLKNTKTLQIRSYIATDGTYHFFGLSTDVNYQLRAQANGMTSKTKTVTVFDSHKVVKLDLKLDRKFKG